LLVAQVAELLALLARTQHDLAQSEAARVKVSN
jgi:hypothetical protein